ncbi:Elongation of very long chain fatty acids protein 1 [Halotydeus destructor]|nr:Elongation of very long chain fatty acids protein 1 [Halotydeus destructor]
MDVLAPHAHSVDKFLDHYGHWYGNQMFPGAPWKIMATLGVYLTFVLAVGPSWMRNRKPMELKTPMRVYNVLNVISNAFVCSIGLIYTLFTYKCWVCHEPESNYAPEWVKGVLIYGYLYLKIFDLMDTVFFVLRKKSNQITVLHLVHHSVMPLTVYLGCKIAPYSPSGMIVICNSFVHVIMYTYYYLASFPNMQQHLWWKKYLTLVQLIQFTIIFTHNLSILTTATCDFPKINLFLQMSESAYFMYAFGKFYFKSYTKKDKAI